MYVLRVCYTNPLARRFNLPVATHIQSADGDPDDACPTREPHELADTKKVRLFHARSTRARALRDHILRRAQRRRNVSVAVRIVADGDVVMAQVNGRNRTKDGRIAKVEEDSDTQLIADTLGAGPRLTG